MDAEVLCVTCGCLSILHTPRGAPKGPDSRRRTLPDTQRIYTNQGSQHGKRRIPAKCSAEPVITSPAPRSKVFRPGASSAGNLRRRTDKRRDRGQRPFLVVIYHLGAFAPQFPRRHNRGIREAVLLFHVKRLALLCCASSSELSPRQSQEHAAFIA